MKKILVSMPEDAWRLLKKELGGKMGESDSELMRTIVLAWASEKGYMAKQRFASTRGIKDSSPYCRKKNNK